MGKGGLLKIKDHIKIELVRKSDGKILESEELHNTIVNAGKTRVAKLLGNVDSVDHFQAIAIGLSSSGDSVSVSDTALVNEVIRSAVTPVYVSDYKCKFEHTFTFGSGESYAIEEAGVFDSATQSGSTMLDRFTFSTKNVDSDIDLKVTVTITIGSA